MTILLVLIYFSEKGEWLRTEQIRSKIPYAGYRACACKKKDDYNNDIVPKSINVSDQKADAQQVSYQS
jgi:hypothetical protein